MKNMGGAGPVLQEADAEAGLMRNGARKWVLRAGRDLRGTSAPALLSMLCAAAFCPLIAVGTDITGAAAVCRHGGHRHRLVQGQGLGRAAFLALGCVGQGGDVAGHQVVGF